MSAKAGFACEDAVTAALSPAIAIGEPDASAIPDVVTPDAAVADGFVADGFVAAALEETFKLLPGAAVLLDAVLLDKVLGETLKFGIRMEVAELLPVERGIELALVEAVRLLLGCQVERGSKLGRVLSRERTLDWGSGK